MCEVLLHNLLPISHPQHPFIGHSQHMPMFFFPDEKPNFAFVHATKYDKLSFNITALLYIVEKKRFIILVNYEIGLKSKHDSFPGFQRISCIEQEIQC